MFLTNFGFRNRVFPQSLSCLYVTETWNFVPETCFFVPSSSRNVKIRFGSLSFFFSHVSVRFRCRYCVNTSKNFTFAATKFLAWFSLMCICVRCCKPFSRQFRSLPPPPKTFLSTVNLTKSWLFFWKASCESRSTRRGVSIGVFIVTSLFTFWLINIPVNP